VWPPVAVSDAAHAKLMVNSASPSIPAQRRSLGARVLTYTCWLATATALVAFVVLFDPTRNQLLIDGLWVLAMGLWVVEVRVQCPEGFLGVSWRWADAWPLLPLLVAFTAVWLPFYDNWRWAYTGDSLSVFFIGRGVAHNGLPINVLSVHGADNNFTYLFSITYNLLELVFAPTLWWHRVTKLVMCWISLVVIYAYFAYMLGRFQSAAIVLATITNSVWVWFSYIGYGLIDSYAFYFMTLLLGTMIWRAPERRGPWMLCGLLGGLSLFFTQTSWSAVIAVGAVLGVYALLTRRFAALAIYAVSFFIAATPILLQFHDFVEMAAKQTASIYEWRYMLRTFRTILTLPYEWSYVRIGVQGAFLRWPLGPLYLVGTVLGALALIPPLRRLLRLPTVVPVLVGMLLWDALLMTLTNHGYPEPSTKRVYNLIPVYVFFGLLPLFVVATWTARWKWAQWGIAGLTFLIIGAYAGANLRIVMYPQPKVYGINVFDGMIELRQRYPERRVVLFSTRPNMEKWVLGSESSFEDFYHLSDTVRVVAELSEAQLHAACDTPGLICFEPHFDPEFPRMVAPWQRCVKPFPLLNAEEVLCYACDLRECGVAAPQ